MAASPGCSASGAQRLVLTVLSLLVLSGCFQERSITLRPGDDFMLQPGDQVAAAGDSATVPAARDLRAWLEGVHARLARHLPPLDARARLTHELAADGVALDVAATFLRPFALQQSLLCNLSGLEHSAQATGAKPAITHPAPDWPGFEQIWIPVEPGLSLSARLGLVRDAATPRVADCVVLLPGLLGDNAVLRTRDVGAALLAHGVHVLALELRGHGQTEARFPDVAYNFGVLETGDLLAVDEWLQARPFVRLTGLVGFCWSANLALLASWSDGRPDADPLIPERLARQLRPRGAARHFQAGVLAFSPVLRFEEIVESLERDRSMLADPMLDALQDTILDRMRYKHYAAPDGNLRRLIEIEFSRSRLNYPGAVEEGLQFLRLQEHRGKPAGRKLESARVPTLIVHAANDPMASPQAVAQLCADSANRNVAAVMLAGGGHVGFAPYARRYFYGLILAYFDPQRGVGTMMSARGTLK